jgi:hypothetical protein
MNTRQHKRNIMSRIFINNFVDSGWYAGGLRLPEVEEAKREFVCQKVKDGSVVDTFDTREDALALVLKHAKQRKAKLQVMDSLTGELVVFAEEELA